MKLPMKSRLTKPSPTNCGHTCLAAKARLSSRVPDRPKPSSASQYYRCQETFEILYTWLRRKGVKDKKPLHVLRKEFGSIINQRHGLYAASAALRHRNISTTAGHYVAHKDRIMFPLGDMLSGIKPLPKASICSRSCTMTAKPNETLSPKKRSSKGKTDAPPIQKSRLKSLLKR